MSAPGSGRLRALATGFAVLFVGTGVNFVFGILFKPILGELGIDRSTLALAATANLLVNAAGQPAFGALVDRFGPRRVILASMALMTVGTALVSRWTRPGSSSRSTASWQPWGTPAAASCRSRFT